MAYSTQFTFFGALFMVPANLTAAFSSNSISSSPSSFLPPSLEKIDDDLSDLSCVLDLFSNRSKIPFFGSSLSAYTENVWEVIFGRLEWKQTACQVECKKAFEHTHLSFGHNLFATFGCARW